MKDRERELVRGLHPISITSCGSHRSLEVVDRIRARKTILRPSELDQDGSTVLLSRRLPQSSLQVAGCEVGSTAGECPGGRLSKQCHRLGVAARIGGDEVGSERVGLSAFCAQQVRRSGVTLGAFARPELSCDRGAHEGVYERERAGG